MAHRLYGDENYRNEEKRLIELFMTTDNYETIEDLIESEASADFKQQRKAIASMVENEHVLGIYRG